MCLLHQLAVKADDFRYLVTALTVHVSLLKRALLNVFLLLSCPKKNDIFLFIHFLCDIVIIFLDLGGSRCLIQRSHSA